MELGVPLTVLEDQHQFILGWHLQWHGGDVDVAVPLVAACQAQYPELRGCSFDRGQRSTAPPTNSSWPRCWSTSRCPRRGEHGTEASVSSFREGKASFVARGSRLRPESAGIRAWNRRSMRWKVMAWTGCARRAGQASNAPWVSRSSQPTCTDSDACCSNGRRGGTIARTHHPIE